MYVYICLFIACHVILALFVFPRLPWQVDLAELTLALVCLIFLALVNNIEPGYIKN